jgi:3-hydroxymyristoyl/3-hydroxydecanoyl-(acyl carrier protein) dehydratase
MEQLSNLTEGSFPSSHRVAMTSDGVVCWEQFLGDVTATRLLVDKIGGDSWSLFDEDSYRFAVGLLALLAEDKRVFIPGENHEAIVQALSEEGTRFMGLFPSASESVPIAFEGTGLAQPLIISGEIVVFTSGSTADAKSIPKSLEQLDAELLALESLWGGQLMDAKVLGTVSHQHLYGLLFSVLWPLCGGRIFWHRPFIEPVLMAREAAAFTRSAWIMSPAHLHRLSEDVPWDIVRDSLVAIFSSGGPLEYSAAQNVFGATGLHPMEVLGSSETGGIAWRQQTKVSTSWQPIPGVEVRSSEEGALVIRSLFLPSPEWYVTADAATVEADGGFVLGDRLDRIVKIDGKRVSLPEVEAKLRTHSWIIEAVAIPLNRRRQCVGVVLVLDAEGEEEYESLGHQLFIRNLRTHLSSRISTTAIPRVWRIVSTLPRNTQGKLLFREILALFEFGRLPRILKQKVSGTACQLQLFVASDSPYFEGHFPSAAVLPGVVQLMWAEYFGRKLLGFDGPFLGMQAIKFKNLIYPDSELTLSLDYSPEIGRLEFSYASRTGQHSQGRLQYGVQS